MKEPFETKHAKSISAKQIKRTLLKPKGMEGSPGPPAPDAVLKWTETMSSARDSAEILWKSYLTEDPENFDAAVKRLEPGSAEIRLLLDIAYQARSPATPSDLGNASARRFEPVKAAIRNDWATEQSQGSKKSKRQFVKDWRHKQVWSSTGLMMTEKALYECLPKGKAEK